MEAKQNYSESLNTYTIGYPQEIDVLSTPDNWFLFTENDNLYTDELWNPLVLY